MAIADAGMPVSYRLNLALSALRRTLRRLRFGGAGAHRVPLRWLRRVEPAPGDRLCLFVALPRDGALLPHSVDHVAAWRDAGYKVIVVVAVAALDEAIDLSAIKAADGIAVRVNRGYDFGAWAAVIRALGEPLRAASVLALANDSVLGPSARFRAMLDRVDRSAADVIGLVESRQVRRHFQSFTLFFMPRALHAPAFTRFWGGVRSGDRDYVIDRYETRLLARMEAAGLRTETLFTVSDGAGNPTLEHWRELVDQGFPYLKVQLLRDNPFGISLTGWQDAAKRGGFDPDRLDRQIAALKQHGGGRWQI